MIHEVLEGAALAVDLTAVVVMLIGFGIALVRFVPTLIRPAGEAIRAFFLICRIFDFRCAI